MLDNKCSFPIETYFVTESFVQHVLSYSSVFMNPLL